MTRENVTIWYPEKSKINKILSFQEYINYAEFRKNRKNKNPGETKPRATRVGPTWVDPGLAHIDAGGWEVKDPEFPLFTCCFDNIYLS